MNSSQVVGVSDRVVAVMATWFLGFAVSKGWISNTDAAVFLPIIVAIPTAIFGWWNNRPASLVASASGLEGVRGMDFSDRALADVAKEADPRTKVTSS